MSNRPSMPFLTEKRQILIGARSSPLSRAQVEEAEAEIQAFFPGLKFTPHFVDTVGDKDKKTSLRTLDKTDFFTKEIDELVLSKKCRIGVHSAKDLPAPIPEGLKVIAVTKGVDPSDSLVFREGESLGSLPPGARIATSSARREETVKALRKDLEFIDLRGTIGERLKKLEEGEADGVVIAEAALIRLKLTHLPRIKLPGETAEGQGRLAIVARKDDHEMQSVFAAIDSRKTCLFLGRHVPQDGIGTKYFHFPIIEIVPRNLDAPKLKVAFSNLENATHLIFTSKPSVTLFFEAAKHFGIPFKAIARKSSVAVGEKTAETLAGHGILSPLVPEDETAEGISALLDKEAPVKPRFFWPRSALSRDVLRNYFTKKSYPFDEAVLYDTRPSLAGPIPREDAYHEIFFTSPSTVDAFLKFFGGFPKGKTLKAIGPVTAKYLTQRKAESDRLTVKRET